MASKEDSSVSSKSDTHTSAWRIDAVIFDMDGVITRTATVHSVAWKRMFDEFLQSHATASGSDFREFDHPRDYLTYVDGRPRYLGVEAFIESRSIALPFGSPDDAPGFETICALGNRKNTLFNQIIEADGVGLYDSTIALIHELRERGIRVGLATSSRNSALILEKTGTASLFETVVDGLVSAKLGLSGKPSPDIFTTACDNLDIAYSRAVVVEDAVSGVQAGSRGGFALTVGVARENNAHELREAGADVVVADLSETTLEELNKLALARPQ